MLSRFLKPLTNVILISKNNNNVTMLDKNTLKNSEQLKHLSHRHFIYNTYIHYNLNLV